MLNMANVLVARRSLSDNCSCPLTVPVAKGKLVVVVDILAPASKLGPDSCLAEGTIGKIAGASDSPIAVGKLEELRALDGWEADSSLGATGLGRHCPTCESALIGGSPGSCDRP